MASFDIMVMGVDFDDDNLFDQQPGISAPDDDDDFPHQQTDHGDDDSSTDDDGDDDEDLFDLQQPYQGEVSVYAVPGGVAIRPPTRMPEYLEAEGGGGSDSPAQPAAAIAALEAAEPPADDCCPVCLVQGEGDGAAAAAWRRVAPCGHRFHAACVEKWLAVKLSCPVCRRPAALAPAPAPAPPAVEAGPRPLPATVEEMLDLSSEDADALWHSARWMQFMHDFHRNGSSAVDSSDVAA